MLHKMLGLPNEGRFWGRGDGLGCEVLKGLDQELALLEAEF